MCTVTRVGSLVGDQPHDGPVFRKHLGSDEDPEHREDLKEKVLEHAGDMLSLENELFMKSYDTYCSVLEHLTCSGALHCRTPRQFWIHWKETGRMRVSLEIHFLIQFDGWMQRDGRDGRDFVLIFYYERYFTVFLILLSFIMLIWTYVSEIKLNCTEFYSCFGQ